MPVAALADGYKVGSSAASKVILGDLQLWPQYLVDDTFTRADSASSLGTATSGQAWTASVGTWGIASNKAYLVSATSNAVALIESGQSDNFMISCDITSTPTDDRFEASLIFRAADSSNFLAVNLIDNGGVTAVRLIKRSAGTFTTLKQLNTTLLTPNTLHHLAVAVQDGAITAAINGICVLGFTLSAGDQTTYESNTKVGIRSTRGGGQDDGGTRFDNFRCRLLATIAPVSADYSGTIVFYPTNPAPAEFASVTGFREQDDILYDPHDPNLATHPERLYKFYYSSSFLPADMAVVFSADGITWSAPVDVVGSGLREDPSVVQKLSSRGEVYRDADGKMWMYSEGETNDEVNVGWSLDGITWSGITAAIQTTAAAWDQDLVGSPTARHTGTHFVVTYEGVTGLIGGVESVGLAYGTSATALTKVALPVWDASGSDPGVSNSVIADSWFLNDAGDKIIFLCHESSDSGGFKMWRGSTTNLNPLTWAEGDIRSIAREVCAWTRNDYTLDNSYPGAKRIVTAPTTDTGAVRLFLLPVT